jgi:hypothetical protein
MGVKLGLSHSGKNIGFEKRDEVREEWRKLHNEEFNDLYSSPNIILVIKSETQT